MTREEYEGWVEFIVKHGKVKPPQNLIGDFDNPEHRIMLARLLEQNGQYIPAICLLNSVMNASIEDINQKIWLLVELGICYWMGHKDACKALEYIDTALYLAEDKESGAHFFRKGQIWYNRLKIICEVEGEEKAEKECDQKIMSQFLMQRDCRHNSYLYYGYLFKAEQKKNQGKIKNAISYLKNAAEHGLNNELMDNIYGILFNNGNDLEKTYEELYSLIDSVARLPGTFDI